MSVPFRIFVGYDSKEPASYHVLTHSILRRASIPVSITPIALSHLGTILTRERDSLASTEFSISRFLVPYLCGYAGWALFMDCDMLCQIDVAELAAYAESAADKAVLCCQHNYIPKTETKFLGQAQTTYPRKNWSSLMLMNTAQCAGLTLDYVNKMPPLALHRLWWAEDAAIGALPLEYNWLVGEYPYSQDAKIVHYTLGGPWFDATADCDYAQAWRAERDRAMNTGD